jgi:hypothetical protein
MLWLVSGQLQHTINAYSWISAPVTSIYFTIGEAYIEGVFNPPVVYYYGYIDHFTFSSRAKTACKVYLDALLVCYFTFDSASSINDSSTLSYITINEISASHVANNVK